MIVGEYTAKLNLQLDKGAAKKMEAELNGRFEDVNEKFSQGFMDSIRTGINALKGAAFVVIAKEIFNAVTGDLEAINAEIDKTLDKYREITGNVSTFGLEPAEVIQLEKIFELADIQGFEKYYQSFADMMRQQKLGKPTPLMNFANDPVDPDTFLTVLNELKNLNPIMRRQVSENIFGAGSAELEKLFTIDIQSLYDKAFAGISREQLNQASGRGTNLAMQERVFEVQRELRNIVQGSQEITPQTLVARDQYLRAVDDNTFAQIAKATQGGYELQRLSLKAQEFGNTLLSKIERNTRSAWQSARELFSDMSEAGERADALQRMYSEGLISEDELNRRLFFE